MNNINNSITKANIPNPALKAFEALIGDWKTEGTHSMMPGVTLHCHTAFTWIEGGAFLRMQSVIYHDQFPAGIAIFGSDNKLGTYFMLYFDEREVSRKQDVKLEGNILKWWRNAPGFSQRCKLTFTGDGNTIIGKGELSADDITWGKDLDLTYTRVI